MNLSNTVSVIVYKNLLSESFDNNIFGLIIILISIFITIFNLCLKYCKNNTASKIYETVKTNNIERSIELFKDNYKYINIPMDQYGYTPFLLACLNGNTKLVEFMLQNGANIQLKSYANETAFYLVCIFHIRHPFVSDASCIQLLYYAMVDMNEPNCLGFAPIQMVAYFGHISLIKWLLKKRANVNLIPRPSTIALYRGYKTTAAILMKIEKNMF